MVVTGHTSNLRLPNTMRQVVQNFRTGEVSVVEVGIPQLRPRGVLVRTMASAVSVGTERSKVSLARRSLVGKALARPDQARRVLEQVRRDGVRVGVQKAFNKVNALSPLGYSIAGIVVAVGDDVHGVTVGDRVAGGGAGFANHAEYVYIPRNLLVPVPDGVPWDQAAFATVGSIALHGVRQADARIGDRIGVVGLGLIGLLTVQLLRAAGCWVLGVEPNRERRDVAVELGAHLTLDPVSATERTVSQATGSQGLDAVIITAASTRSGILDLAARLCRDRGRIVVVGDVPIAAERESLYRKEVELKLSRSYGPGRYDRGYEEHGHDYPFSYVRWTEQRNMAEVLRLVADGALNLDALISQRVSVDEAGRLYKSLQAGNGIGYVLTYGLANGGVQAARPTRSDAPTGPPAQVVHVGDGPVGVGLCGAGNYVTGVLLPLLKEVPNVLLTEVVSGSGLSAENARRRYGFRSVGSNLESVLADPLTHAVLIGTPHHLHAFQAESVLLSGRFAFVEKPMAMTLDELKRLAMAAAGPSRLMVGYNRRFSRHAMLLRDTFARRVGVALLVVRVNAGAVPQDHWSQDPAVGGGRIIGELCHFVDLAQYLVGSPIASVRASGIGHQDAETVLEDNVTAVLDHRDGSTSTLVYTSKGDPGVGKELVELFADGMYGTIHDFKESQVRGPRLMNRRHGTDKGQKEELRRWVTAVKTGTEMPISLRDLLNSAEATLAVRTSLHTGSTVVMGAR